MEILNKNVYNIFCKPYAAQSHSMLLMSHLEKGSLNNYVKYDSLHIIANGGVFVTDSWTEWAWVPTST